MHRTPSTTYASTAYVSTTLAATAVAALTFLCVLLWATRVDAALTTKTFESRLERLAAAAKGGEWKRVRHEADRLLQDLNESLSARASNEEANRRALANVLSLRSLGESALGEEREAVWDWFLAQDLWPPLRGASLSAYGEPAKLLRDNPWEPAAVDTPEGEETPTGQVRRCCRGVEAPVKLRSPSPTYPLGARMERVEAKVILQTVITATGAMTKPRVLGSPAPAFSVAAAEALRQWTFAPATLDGEPVAVCFNLTVDFTLW